MTTENKWKDYYKKQKGVYFKGLDIKQDDADAIILKEYHRFYIDTILDNYGIDRFVLELGCGNKPVFDVLNRFGKIFYTDISKDALKKAKKEFEEIISNKKLKSEVEFKVMNVEKFDFEDDFLDVVFNTRAPHRDETSRELFRTLRYGGVYIYQTIGEEDFKDFKLLFRKGRFYNDYLKKSMTRFEVIKKSLISAGFRKKNITLIFDKFFKTYFNTKEELKDRLWLLVGDYNFDLPENEKVLDKYIESHSSEDGKIYVKNHRLIIKAVK